MKLNHVNLPVHDVEAARDFFVRYFGLVTVQEVGKNFLAILRDDNGLVLNLSHFDKKSTAEVDYHKDFHIGFFVESREEADRIYQSLVADEVATEAPSRRESRYGFYVTAPGGIVVEVACMEWRT